MMDGDGDGDGDEMMDGKGLMALKNGQNSID